MFIVPRTPLSPVRKPLSPKPNENIPVKDVYDKFIEIFFSVDTKIQSVFLERIIRFVGHPAYSHLLRTMDKDNAHHVMGYLRSQRSVEMYIILDQICRSPLPTRDDFYHTISGF